MAFNVNFYNFAKRENSTYRPGGSGSSYSCILKESSSIANPTIILDVGTGDDPSWNYAYIQQFNRYYYVSDWTWIQNRLWQASLTTDLLATFRDYIGASNMYVLRSSAAYDGSIIDNYYPVKAEATQAHVYGAYQWPLSISGGSVVIGVVSKDATIGSLCYYALTINNFAALIQAMLDDTILKDFDPEDASLALQKALVDPLQYVKSAVYLPIGIGDLAGSNSNVSVWNWKTNVSAKKLDITVPWTEKAFTLTIPKHPLTAARGNYLNVSPYTRASFEFIPFGSFEIDTTLTAVNPEITVNYLIDWINGTGTLVASCGNNTLGILTGQVGVPVQISQVSKDYLGATVGTVNTIGNAISDIMSGNWGGLVSGAASGIGNGIQSMIPHSAHISSNGSYSHFHWFPSIYVEFYTPVNEDIEHSGRPLCQIRQLGSLPGYLLIKDGEIDIPGLTGEAEAVRAYLESGFFYG